MTITSKRIQIFEKVNLRFLDLYNLKYLDLELKSKNLFNL